MATEDQYPTENKLINEPYERIDRLNYKDRADRHVDHGDELFSGRQTDELNAQAAIVQQQREMFEDVRSQRDRLNAQAEAERQQLFAATMDLVRQTNSANIEQLARTNADAWTLSLKELDKGTTEVSSEALGGKVVQDLEPVVNNAVKSAVAAGAGAVQGAVGATGWNTAATVNRDQVTATIAELAAAFQALAAQVQNITEMQKNDA